MSCDRPICSVCIANYNGQFVLADCIDSVLAQTGDISYEIIVHDDASSDESMQLMRKRYPSDRYPQIRFIEGRANVGFCKSNNRMASAARGEYLLLLNNDAALAPDALSALVAAAERQSPKGVLTLPQIDWQTGELVDRGCLLDPFYNPLPNLSLQRNDVAMVIGACLWVPRDLWQAMGGFPEWFESIAEDMYFCCRVRLAGRPVAVADGSHYRHRQGASFGGSRVKENRLESTYRRRRLSERNKTYVMVTCTPVIRLCLTLPLHLLLLAVEGAVLALAKRDARIWRDIYGNALLSVLRRSPFLRAERRITQGLRAIGEFEYGKTFGWMPRKIQLLCRHGMPEVR